MASAPTHSSYAKSPVRRARFASLSAPYSQCICQISSENSQVCIPFCTLLTVHMPDLQWEEPGLHPFLHPTHSAYAWSPVRRARFASLSAPYSQWICQISSEKSQVRIPFCTRGKMRGKQAAVLSVRVRKMKAICGCGVRCVCLYVSAKWRPSEGVGCDAFVYTCQ